MEQRQKKKFHLQKGHSPLKYVSYPDYWPSYEISLQSITEDYYRYLKSMQLYRISREDTYSEGVYIHSNNEGGWGLLGGISGEVHRVEPFKDMNESSEGNGIQLIDNQRF
ncbi:MAG: DUF4249 family protein [Candidatus Saccharibacteria bacterium]|nr:DUF4249 family protein [Candidatus Saccharibacteria bacterium]